MISDEEVTIIILAHPVKSHPSTELIEKAYNSLAHLGLGKRVKVIIAHDAPKKNLAKDRILDFNHYLENVKIFFKSEVNVTILANRKHEFLSGNIKKALGLVKTPFVLIMQHDLAFCSDVNIPALIEVMKSNDHIKHVRFNKRGNSVREGWDFYIKARAEFIRQFDFQTTKGDLSLLRTLAWSDQNHLTTVNYYKNLVLPLCGRFKVYPEDMLNPFTRPGLFSTFGNYVYGNLSTDATIEDLDGSKGRWEEMSKLDTYIRRFRMALHYRRNKLVLLKILLKNES